VADREEIVSGESCRNTGMRRHMDQRWHMTNEMVKVGNIDVMFQQNRSESMFALGTRK
jgi:hypothetical protein